jgi:RNA polymerase sigma-70 factor (ECF subfamily)
MTNGQPSVVARHEGSVRCVLTINASADGIQDLLWMFNPDKLTAFSNPG